MDLQTRKINFIQEFLKLQNEELVASLENLLKKGKVSDKGIKPMSVDEFNQRIDQSLNDSKNGRLTSTNDLIAEIEEWQ